MRQPKLPRRRDMADGTPMGRGTMLCASLRPRETFGSWFRATARLHGCSRLALAKALMTARKGDPTPGEIDWDVHPPLGLLDELGRRLPRGLLTELRRRIPSSHADLLRPSDRGALCARCMGEGAQDPLWGRCEDLWPWTVVCARHHCPLVGISWHGEEPRPHITPGPRGRAMPCSLSEPLSAAAVEWLLEVQALFRPARVRPQHIQLRFKDRTEFDESLARLIIRDLVVASACDVQGTTLLEWSLPQWRRWVWRTEDGVPLSRPPSWAPLGDLYLRQEAIRLAGQIWHCLHGDFSFDRPGDERTYRIMRQIRASSSYGRFFGELLSHWPRSFQAKWTHAFGTTWRRAERVSRATHVYPPRSTTRDVRHALKLTRPRAGKLVVKPCVTRRFPNTRPP